MNPKQPSNVTQARFVVAWLLAIASISLGLATFALGAPVAPIAAPAMLLVSVALMPWKTVRAMVTERDEG